MAGTAEQDNRVQIPNGTAAVNAIRSSLVKAGHWIILGRPELLLGAATHKA